MRFGSKKVSTLGASARLRKSDKPVRASERRIREIFSKSILPQPDEAVGFLLWRTLLVYQRRAEDVLADVGLTHLQFAVLATAGWLALSSPEVIQRHIVKQSGIKEAQVSLMIKALRMKGMLLQEAGLADPRVRAIRLTEHGARSLEAAIPLIHAIQNELWPTSTMQRETAKVLMEALRRWNASSFASMPK